MRAIHALYYMNSIYLLFMITAKELKKTGKFCAYTLVRTGFIEVSSAY